MKIPANASTKYLRKTIADLRDEATGWHQQAKNFEDQLAAAVAENVALANSRINTMGDNKPWKLAAIALIVGVIIGWVAG